jgi:hypothetical protein
MSNAHTGGKAMKTTKSYDEWAARIKACWDKDAARGAKAKAKMDKAIAKGEYRVDGSYTAYGKTIRVVTKV